MGRILQMPQPVEKNSIPEDVDVKLWVASTDRLLTLIDEISAEFGVPNRIVADAFIGCLQDINAMPSKTS